MKYPNLRKRMNIIYISGRHLILSDISEWMIIAPWRSARKVWRMLDTVVVTLKSARKTIPAYFIKNINNGEIFKALFLKYKGCPISGIIYKKPGPPLRYIKPGLPLRYIKKNSLCHMAKDSEKKS